MESDFSFLLWFRFSVMKSFVDYIFCEGERLTQNFAFGNGKGNSS